MSSKYGIQNRDRGGQDDVDFDFFESPRSGRSARKSDRDNRESEKQATSMKQSKSDSNTRTVANSMSRLTTQVPTAKQDESSDSYDSESDNDGSASGRKSRVANKKRKDSGSANSSCSASTRSSSGSTSRSRSRSRSYSPDTQRDRDSARPKSGRPRDRKTSNRHSDSSCTDSDSDTSYSSDSQDSDITDVSPLASPHRKTTNKHVTLSDMPTMLGKPPTKSSRPKSAKKAAQENLLNPDSDTMNLKLLMEAVLEMEGDKHPSRMSRPRSGKQFSIPKGPTSQNKKNMSFTNDKTRDIDRENQRLMQEIVKYATMTKKSQKKKKKKVQSQTSPSAKLTSSAVNRDREQRRIDQENMAMLQRLKSVKPSNHLRREDLIDTYSNHLLFGIPMGTVHPVEKKKLEKPPSPYESALRSRSATSLRGTSASSSGRQRPFSAQVRQARPVSGKLRPHSAKVGGSTMVSEHDWESGW